MKNVLLVVVILTALLVVAHADDITVVEFPETYAACIKMTDMSGEGMGEAFGSLAAWVGKNNLFNADTKFMSVSEYFEGETPPQGWCYYATVTIGKKMEGEGDIIVQEIGDGTYAMYTYKGAYEGMVQAWLAFRNQVAGMEGYTWRESDFLEVYLNDPNETAEEDLLTELYIPVKKN